MKRLKKLDFRDFNQANSHETHSGRCRHVGGILWITGYTDLFGAGRNMRLTVLSKLFRWEPSREVLVSTMAGFVILGLSALMIPTRDVPWVSILIRDIGMIFLIGIFFPLVYMQSSGRSFNEFGLTLRRWYIVFPINFILGVLLLLLFLSENPDAQLHLDGKSLASISFIMLAGVFEVVFFYSFQRTLFERAFGIIPGIIVAALFYSFHHLGFQPEFGKLFFVGLMYATTFRMGNSAFMIYPFFWGVGGCYDVLVQSQKVLPISYPELRSLYLGFLIVALLAWIIRSGRRK
jgi:hypothetical protein